MPRACDAITHDGDAVNGDALGWIRPASGLCDGTRSWSGADLRDRALRVADRLRDQLPAGSVVGSLADNSPAWLIGDLALAAAGMVHVPLPAFFSPGQMQHAIDRSGMTALLCPDDEAARWLGFRQPTQIDAALRCHGRACDPRSVTVGRLEGIAKITFTSGTTGAPKGVLLTCAQQQLTACSLAQVTAPLGISRHLCLLPLAVLLENVAGAYTALTLGATCIVPDLAQTGMIGSSSFDPVRCLDSIARHDADSVILLPQMLAALVSRLEAEPNRRAGLSRLKYAAVGGASTPPSLLHRARGLGLPVHEGYGLSECASVVTLNRPGADRPGSVGRPLPGVGLRRAADGEIEILGRGPAGYLGQTAPSPTSWFGTGDLGELDAQGYLWLRGRKKHVLVTSFGRNVSPEWPEGLLTEHPGIAQALVVGDARPWLCAIVVALAGVPDAAIEQHVDALNERLPDYARIRAWHRADAPFTPDNQLATANGRMRRDAVLARYATAIEAMYRAPCANARPQRPAVAHALRRVT